MAAPALDILFLDTHSLKTIAIGDYSVYPTNFNIQNPTIEITPPGWNRISQPFTPNNLNLFNSNNLNITCADAGESVIDLPDGRWQFKYSISPSNIHFTEKNIFRTDNIKHRFGTAFLYTDIKEKDADVKDEDLDILDQIWALIISAQSEGNNCNYEWASKKYQLASKMLDNFFKNK